MPRKKVRCNNPNDSPKFVLYLQGIISFNEFREHMYKRGIWERSEKEK